MPKVTITQLHGHPQSKVIFDGEADIRNQDMRDVPNLVISRRDPDLRDCDGASCYLTYIQAIPLSPSFFQDWTGSLRMEVLLHEFRSWSAEEAKAWAEENRETTIPFVPRVGWVANLRGYGPREFEGEVRLHEPIQVTLEVEL